MSDAPNLDITNPEVRAPDLRVIDDTTPWINYTGHWGEKNGDGPRGPKYNEPLPGQEIGRKWQCPFDWWTFDQGHESDISASATFSSPQACQSSSTATNATASLSSQASQSSPISINLYDFATGQMQVGTNADGSAFQVGTAEYLPQKDGSASAIIHNTDIGNGYTAEVSSQSAAPFTLSVSFPQFQQGQINNLSYNVNVPGPFKGKITILPTGSPQDYALHLDTNNDGDFNDGIIIPTINQKSFDFIPPNRISDLAVASVGPNTASLTWTANGDNGSVGQAAEYEVRYSNSAITDDYGWASAEIADGTPVPQTSGNTENFTINPIPGGDYYFAIRVKDKANNTADISNSVSAHVPAPIVSNLSPTGWINSSSPTISANFSEDGAGYTIDPNSVVVSLDGQALSGCDVTPSSASCPTANLAEGQHNVAITIGGESVNNSSASFNVDYSSPTIASVLPNDWVNTANSMVNISYSDSGSGVNPDAVSVQLDGNQVSGCIAAATGLSCPISGYADGNHQISVTLSDNAGNSCTASGSFQAAVGKEWSPWQARNSIYQSAVSASSPSLIQLQNGQTMIVYAEADSLSELKYQYSNDGTNWSAPVGITGTDSGAAPSVSQLPSGKVVVAFAKPVSQNPTTWGIDIVTSDDLASWSAPVSVVSPATQENAQMPAAAALPGGQLLIAYNWGQDGAAADVYSVKGNLNNATWSWAAPALIHHGITSANIYDSKPALLTLDNGSVLCAFDTGTAFTNRDGWGERSIYAVSSDDAGVTWQNQNPTLVYSAAGTANIEPSLLRIGNGEIWAGFASSEDNGINDLSIKMVKSFNGGATWSAKETISAGSGSESWPALSQRKNGQILTVWDSDPAQPSSTYNLWQSSRIDIGPPIVSNVSPTGQITASTATVSADYSDVGSGIDLSSFAMWVDQNQLAGCITSVFHANCSVTGLKYGTHSISGHVSDYAGHQSRLNSSFNVVDSVPPTVFFFEPAGTIFSDSTVVRVHFSDADPSSGIDTSSVSVSLDGTKLTTCSASVGGASCPVAGLGYGAHEVSGSMSDHAGNSSPISGSFNVGDNKAPVVGVVTPTGLISSSSPVITASYTDASPSSGFDPTAATLSLNGSMMPGVCTVNAGGINCPVSGLADGNYNVSITLTDNAGNASSGNGNFKVDTTPPTISDLSPQGFTRPYGTISASLNDSSGIDANSVAVTLDGNPVNGCVVMWSNVYCPMESVGDGSHSYDISVRDILGNQAVSTGNFKVDTTAPVISNIQPSGTTTSGSGAITAEYSDPDPGSGVNEATIQANLNGNTLSCSVSQGSISCPFSNLVDGVTYNIQMSIGDNAGNWQTANSSFRVDLTRYIRDDATGGDCPTIGGSWDLDSKTCTLGSDSAGTHLEIASDNVSLDGDGHTLSGTGVGKAGVFLSHRSGVTVRNLGLAGSPVGIYLYYSSGNTISGNNASGNSSDGIYIYSSSNNNVTNNNSSNNGNKGLRIRYSGGNTFSGNKMWGNYTNFYIYGATDSDFDNEIDSSNLVDGKPIYYIKNAQGGNFDGSTNAGTFYCINCDHVTISGLNLSSQNDAGIYLRNTQNSTVQNNNISNSYYGIYEKNSSNNSLTGNNSSNNNTGIGIYSSSNMNTVSGNSFISNSWSGIDMSRSNQNSFSGNLIDQSLTGVYCLNATSSNDNRFVNNDFIYAYTPVYLWNGTGNNFNIDGPDGGNYWSGYNEASEGCNDSNSDGFCDDAMVFSGGTDVLPWVTQDGWLLPRVTNIQPSDTIYNDYATIRADFSSPFGIDSASVAIYLDGNPVAGCAVSPTGASCPTNGLAYGTHSISGSVSDVRGKQVPISGAFNVGDNAPPIVTGIQPAGTIYTNSVNITASYGDSLPSSGINTASVAVYLDGNSVSCTVTATSASCPISGLTFGPHLISGSIADNAGNIAPISGSFDVGDNTAPAVADVLPTDTVYGGSAIVGADYSDPGISSGIDTASVMVYMDGNQLSGCTATETNVSCETSGLASGTHTITGSVADNSGNVTPFSGSFLMIEWSQASVIYQSGLIPSQPSLHQLADGRTLLVYTEQFTNALKFEVSSDGVNWQIPQGSTGTIPYAAGTQPSITQLSSGQIVVSYANYVYNPFLGHYVWNISITTSSDLINWSWPSGAWVADSLAPTVTALDNNQMLLTYTRQTAPNPGTVKTKIGTWNGSSFSWGLSETLVYGDSHYNSKPSVANLGNNEILCAFYQDTVYHDNNDILARNIYAVRSIDGGLTWQNQSPTPVYSGSGADFWPSLIKLNDGRVVCAFTTSNGGSVDQLNIEMVISSDRGYTWGSPQMISIAGHSETWPALAQRPDGSLIAVWDSDPSQVSNVYYLYSSRLIVP
ncbi:MAG: NosD domain-containing protein [Thermoleophilia bacterium]